MRAVIALFLSFVLAIGSVSMAVAHGQMPMGETITICTEDGTTSIILDTNGNPVAPAFHLCPDCLSAVAAGLPDSGASLPRPADQSRPAVFVEVQSPQGRIIRLIPPARGPPVVFA